jgi:hypothetical protein
VRQGPEIIHTSESSVGLLSIHEFPLLADHGAMVDGEAEEADRCSCFQATTRAKPIVPMQSSHRSSDSPPDLIAVNPPDRRLGGIDEKPTHRFLSIRRHQRRILVHVYSVLRELAKKTVPLACNAGADWTTY